MIELPDGIVVQHDGQDYRLVGGRLHVRLNGTPTWLLVWETDCPACGDEFEVLTPRQFRGPKRFCDGCRETLGHTTAKAWRRRQAQEFRRQCSSDAPDAAVPPSEAADEANPEPQESF